jgi:hypothetical protein
MKISLSRFGFCGIVTQELLSLRDVTTIGRFTTIMIRIILILTVLVVRMRQRTKGLNKRVKVSLKRRVGATDQASSHLLLLK